MTPEGKVKEKIKNLLRRYGVYYHMPVMNGMGAPTLDFIACPNGRFMAIEAKVDGKNLTARQHVTKAEMEASGGFVFRVSNADELAVVEAYLNLLGCIPDETKIKGGSNGRQDVRGLLQCPENADESGQEV